MKKGRGRPEQPLVIDGDWESAVGEALTRGRPPKDLGAPKTKRGRRAKRRKSATKKLKKS